MNSSPQAGCSRTKTALLEMCIAEARPVVQVMFALRYLCGALLAGPAIPAWRAGHVTAGLAAWELAVVSVYLLNGTQDMVEDRVNGSARPIARGDLPRHAALGAAAVCAGCALLASSLIGPGFTALVLAFLALGVLYSCRPFSFKTGAVPCALSGTAFGLLSYCAGVVAAGRTPHAAWLVFVLPMALWTGLIGSACKDLSDVAGDATVGRRTAAVRFGATRIRLATPLVAAATAAGFMLAALSASVVMLPAAFATAAGVGLVAAACLRARRPPVGRDRKPYRAFMATQYAAHACALGTVLAMSGA